jgi:signal transduction histidine kinase
VGSIITKLNLELQLDKLKNNDPIQLKAISHYQNYVEKIREGLKDLVQIIDNKAYDFRDFKASVREIAYDYLENTTIRLQINMPEHIQNPILSYQIKRNLECILKEALQNILKHSQASNVTMELNINHGIIMFNIMDDGIGIHTSTKSGSKGLTNIRQRIIKLNGMLKIISSEHEIGTKLIMQIPY